MKRKIIFWTNAIVALIVLTLNILYLFVWHTHTLIKSGNCVLYVLLGILNFVAFYKDSPKKSRLVSLFVTLGLLFGMLGDILLGKNFIVGAVLFALGHIFYLSSFVCIKKYGAKDLLVLLALMALVAIVLLVPSFDFGKYLPIIVGYAIVICTMTSKAISNLIFGQKNIQNILLCIGATLFFISDLMLMLYNFGSPIKVFDYLCLLTYFPAQIIFAISIFKFKK